MENSSFIFKQKKSTSYKIATILMLILGIVLLQYFLFGGIVICLSSIFFFSFTSGIEIDFENRKYRNTINIGSVSFGKWNDLPEIIYISVFKVILTSAIVGRFGARVTNKEKIVLINLIYGKNKRLMIYKTEDKKDAFEKALFFKQKLNLRIYDATSKVGKWYDETNTTAILC